MLVDGKEQRHPEGAYYLEWREDGKRVRLSVGKDAQDADPRRLRKEAELNAVNNGVAVLPENSNNGKSRIPESQIRARVREDRLVERVSSWLVWARYYRRTFPKPQICLAHEFRNLDSVYLSRQSALCLGFLQFGKQSVCEVQHALKGTIIPGANRNQQFLFRTSQGYRA